MWIYFLIKSGDFCLFKLIKLLRYKQLSAYCLQPGSQQVKGHQCICTCPFSHPLSFVTFYLRGNGFSVWDDLSSMKHTGSASPSVCVRVCTCLCYLLLTYYTSQPPLPPVKISQKEVGGSERSVSTIDVLWDVRDLNTTGEIWAKKCTSFSKLSDLFFNKCFFSVYRQSH